MKPDVDKDFYNNGKYTCPNLVLTIESTNYTIYINEKGASGPSQIITTDGKLKVLKEDSETSVETLTDSCTALEYKASDSSDINFDYNVILNMYSSGRKEVCIDAGVKGKDCQSTKNNEDLRFTFNGQSLTDQELILIKGSDIKNFLSE